MKLISGKTRNNNPVRLAVLLALVGTASVGWFFGPLLSEALAKNPPGQEEVIKGLKARNNSVRGRINSGKTIEEAPGFKVKPRQPSMEFYPCDDCHDQDSMDKRVRILEEEHPKIKFEHGGGRFWCYDACHNPPDMNVLQGKWGDTIGFNESYKLCGDCHFERQKDWYFGGHGKRVGAFSDPKAIPLTYKEFLVKDREKIGTWQGERVLLNCTACHDPHSPSIKPYKLSPVPLVRSGLEKGSHEPHAAQPHLQIWDRLGKKH
ncbi:MAG: hypothetical protein OEZ59_04715 [Deltaproteobacteria bacterium]|nr:hypothetical protein [Deltaproteobacteria bacterium]